MKLDLLESLPCPALFRDGGIKMNTPMQKLLGTEEAALLLNSVPAGEKKPLMLGGKTYRALLSDRGLLLLVPEAEEEEEEEPSLSLLSAGLRDAVSTALLAASGLRKQKDPVSHRYAGPLSRSLDRVVRIIDNLRIESLESRDAMKEENLIPVLTEIVDGINAGLGTDAAELRIEPGDAYLVCSRELIASLVMNLTVEALLPAGGKVSVFLRPGKIYALDFLLPLGHDAREEWEELLFSRKGRGTAFAAVRRIVALHEGGIFLREEEGKLLVHVTLSRRLRVGADVFAPASLYQGGDFVYMMLSPLERRLERE